MLALALAACGGGGDGGAGQASSTSGTPATPAANARTVLGVRQSTPIASFNAPWALKVLPDGRFLVSQRSNPGALTVVDLSGQTTAVTGLPANIGLLDLVLAPDFSSSRTLYLSFMQEDRTAVRFGRAKDEPDLQPQRLAVARARLVLGGGSAELADVQIVFAQLPWIVAYKGSGEPGGRMVFSPDGRHLFISAGDRQELDRDLLFRLDNHLGKVVRLMADGSVPADNPFVGVPGARPEIWSLGHRNAYGLAFSADGTLWSSEMGPLGGDEFNVIRPGLNYGWPAVSNGSHYSGDPIPDHAPGDGFEAPKWSWTPVIAPAGMLFYTGALFEDWTGSALLTGLQSHGLVRVKVTGSSAGEIQRIDLGTRVRDIAQGPGGSLWVLTDGPTGQLLAISPVF